MKTSCRRRQQCCVKRSKGRNLQDQGILPRITLHAFLPLLTYQATALATVETGDGTNLRKMRV